MRAVEKHNQRLKGVLFKTYTLFTGTLLKELLKEVSETPAGADFDALGRIYGYLLGEFTRAEGQKGGDTRQRASSSRLRRSLSPSTAASSTRPAARAACSCNRRASSPSVSTRYCPRRTPGSEDPPNLRWTRGIVGCNVTALIAFTARSTPKLLRTDSHL